MNAKGPCPCGSGKRYKHCHGPRDRAKKRMTVLLALLAVAVGAAVVAGWPLLQGLRTPAPATTGSRAAGATAARPDTAVRADAGKPVLGETTPGGLVRAPIPDPNELTVRPPNSGELAPGEHPRPWEYDVAHNRYYDPRPGHMHWHSGQPPADTTRQFQAPVVVVSGGKGGPVTVTTTSVKVAPARAAGAAAGAPGGGAASPSSGTVKH
jgi:hypothetical protein